MTMQQVAGEVRTEAEMSFRALACSLHGSDQQIMTPGHGVGLRTLRVTPYDGNYGTAGWMLAVEGSPPLGLFVTDGDRFVVYISQSGRSRRLGPMQTRAVLAYLKETRAYHSDGS